MGRIDRSDGQDATMERRHIQAMLRHIEGYELVKRKTHPEYRTATEFYAGVGVCKQNFLKYYRRYVTHGRELKALIPHRTGRKFKDVITYAPEIIAAVQDIRSRGYNRYDISLQLKALLGVELPPTTIYRLMKKLGINQLNPVLKEEKRRIIKMQAGELGHIDIHYLTKATVRSCPNQKIYLLGIIDSYSRVCWVEVMNSIKATQVTFTAMEALMRLKQRYGIQFVEMMSDNGQEFASKNNPDHPFEKMLSFYGIKHRYTKPFTPKTNGKIERFWKTIEDELLSGEQFDTIEELKHYIIGYNVYYNEHRIHQGINNKKPCNFLQHIPEPTS
jgi:transposase InsO family protein